MRILVSGASGFLGAPLCHSLKSKGHHVVSLVRKKTNQPNEIFWDFVGEPLQPQEFDQFDAVIHLVGEPLTLTRWSFKKKERIRKSRVDSTKALSKILEKVSHPPKVFLSASAVGFYGNRNGDLLGEDEPQGEGFLAGVCREWERASQNLKKPRKAFLRFGIILGKNGGTLGKMVFPYKLGLGGVIGKGVQWISWIHRADAISAIEFILENKSLEGPLNICSPKPVQQKTFSQILSKLLHKPAFLKIPVFLLKLVFGVSAKELFLSSIRAQPKKLLEAGFQFRYESLENALEEIL